MQISQCLINKNIFRHVQHICMHFITLSLTFFMSVTQQFSIAFIALQPSLLWCQIICVHQCTSFLIPQNVMHSKERIEGSPLLPILSTSPGTFQPSQVISKVSLPFLNNNFNQAVSVKRTHLFIQSYSGVYWPLTNHIGFHSCSFSEQPWVRLILTLRILQHVLLATLCS